MGQVKFKTRREWFRWYSSVYLKCHHWRNVVRPAVWEYRNGTCCFCGKKIPKGPWHCHHGEGMYQLLGYEHKHLDRMFAAHVRCHERHTKKERAGILARKAKRAILGR